MTLIGLPFEAIVGGIMLLFAIPYVLRERLASWSWPTLAIRRPSNVSPPPLTPRDLLPLIERTDASPVRDHLVTALNCLLEDDHASVD